MGDEFEYAFVGEKPKFIKRNSFYNVLEKGQGEADGFRKIEGGKAATEEAGSAFGFTLGH
jgi:hypothetical protein